MSKTFLTQDQIEDLLDYIGVEKVGQWKGDKINFCCPIHHEKNPSCGINADYVPDDEPFTHYQVFNCFHKDTKVITKDGVKPIRDLIGKKTFIINGNGQWEEVEFKRYGKQLLYELTLTSNGLERKILATGNHDWLVRDRVHKIHTKDLKVGQRLTKQWLHRDFNLNIDIEGLKHGFLFGDGTLIRKGSKEGHWNNQVVICGDIKRDFCDKVLGLDIKPPSKSHPQSVSGRATCTTVYNAKELPDIKNCSLDYLFSFLAGLFVADGNCSYQCIGITNSNKSVVEAIQHICILLGIPTYPITKQVRTPDSNMGLVKLTGNQTQYSIRLVKSSIPDNFWVSGKRPSYGATYSNYLGHSVKSVKRTNLYTDVYCCETSTHSFVLDGYILTGNCFSCGASGSLVWFLYKSLPDDFKSVYEAEQFMADRYGLDYSHTLSDLRKRSLKRIGNEPVKKDTNIKKVLSIAKIAPFKSGKATFKYFFKRGFDKQDMKEWKIGRDLDSRTVTIPAFWEDGSLAGVIGRYIDPDRPKNSRYKIYDFEKSKLVFPENKLEVINDTIIGVEGMFDCIMLHKWGRPNTVALMGNKMSNAQADYIAKHCKRFIALFDNDSGGDKAIDIARKRLKDRVEFLTCDYTDVDGKDPSEWGEIETNRILSTASVLKIKNLRRL